MKTVKVYFEDGNSLTTSINGTKKEIEKYYIGKSFQFGDTESHPKDKMIKAVKVEHLQTFKFSFVGRKSGAIGKTYAIKQAIKAFNLNEAINELYTHFEHISTLCVNGEILAYKD
jgi:hypothetical protein